MKVPLLLRAPNPPARFVGRRAEREIVAGAIARAPVTVLCGFGGLGKSALVAQVLADDFSARRDQTVVADTAGSADGPVDVALRVLAEATSAAMDWAALTASPALAARTVVETIEDHGLWLLVENLSRAEDEALAATLELAAKYARDARIIVVSREDPRLVALREQTITLGPMSDDDLAELLAVHVVDVPRAQARALVARANGSPWRLLQMTLGDVSDPAGPERSLEQLAPAAQGLLRTLALIGGALPRDVVAQAARLPTDKAMDALARRGFLDVTPAGLRLHDAARPYVVGSIDEEERALRGKRLLDALRDAGTLSTARAAVLLALRHADVKLALSVLDERGESVLQDGHARVVFDALFEADDARLGAWMCRAAVEAGGTALSLVPAPPADHGSSTLAWAHVRLHAGDAAGGIAAASTVTDETHVIAAGLVTGRCHLNLGAPEAARAALAPLAPRSADERTARDALLAIALASLGDEVDASALAIRTKARLETVSEQARPQAAVDLASAFFELGDVASALGLVRPIAGRADAARSAAGRLSLISLAHLAVNVGQLARAQDAITRLGPGSSGSLFDADLQAVELHRRLAAGELAGADQALDDLQARARAHDWSRVERTATTLKSELDVLRGRASRTTAAANALTSGDPNEALRLARRAQAIAGERGHRLVEVDATMDVADALLVLGDREGLAQQAQRLDEAGSSMPSERVALAARFYSLAATGGLDAGALAGLARAGDRSPCVARRATFLLGEDAALDEVDRRVVSALADETPREEASAHVGSGDGPQWVVDEAGTRVVLPDGAVVDLSKRRVLLALLVALCRRGGEATKEQLLADVWQIDDYHPLNHDNRLKVAVRKLRRALEEPLGEPPLESVDEGYRLRGRVRFVGV